MTDAEVRATVLTCLGKVAPEADAATLRPDAPIRDQVDIDSMDFLRFVIEIDQALHVAVPESDYGQIETLDGCVRYLAARLPGTSA